MGYFYHYSRYKIDPDERTYLPCFASPVLQYVADELEDFYRHSEFSAYSDLYRYIFKLFADNRIRQREFKARQKKHQEIMLRIANRKFNKIKQAFELIRSLETETETETQNPTQEV